MGDPVSLGAALSDLVKQHGTEERLCDKHGPYTSIGRSLGRIPDVHWSACPMCPSTAEAEAVKANRDAAMAARVAFISEVAGRAGVPERYAGKGFSEFVAETDAQRAALAAVKDFAEGFGAAMDVGRMLVLSGGVGTGKTHLACAALQAVMLDRTGMFTTVTKMIRMIRDTWRRDSERTEADVLRELSRLDLLVIDEIGVQYGTDAELLLVFEVIDSRYQDKRPTIMLTNLDQKNFRATVGDRVMDRLREVGRWVTFDWESYRPKARAQEVHSNG